MIFVTVRKVAAVLVFACITGVSVAQDPGPKTKSASSENNLSKPFRILTSGQRITIQSHKNISNIIVWTASGDRFVEQNNVASPSYNFSIPSKEKYVFMMLQLEDGKRYTEKIGVH
ncbi:MAG TPA: hypothetical protein VFP87_10210 [Chitinophagaceae bacterium]|nr:hypothetical protein [Chitinophagaceae bacterium]